MATIEGKIKNKQYETAGSARAAVTRSNLSKVEKNRLHELATSVYSQEAKASLGPLGTSVPVRTNGNGHVGPTHVEADSLHKIALRVTLYAMDNGKPVNEVLAEIHSIIRNA